MVLLNVSSNNESEYEALIKGLEWCVSNGITRLNVYGDSMLIVKHVQGIWSCKSDKLASKLKEVKALFKRIKYHQIHYVGRSTNQDTDALASECLKEVTIGAVKLQEPKMQGRESLHDVLCFIETWEPPPHLIKGERRWLARKAVRYRLIGQDLFCKGKDQVSRKVPSQEDIHHGPFEKWGIDAIGPLPRTVGGKEYIIVGVDYMTRWAEALPAGSPQRMLQSLSSTTYVAGLVLL